MVDTELSLAILTHESAYPLVVDADEFACIILRECWDVLIEKSIGTAGSHLCC